MCRSNLRVLAPLAVCVTLAACGDDNTPSTPTSPTPPGTVTENFSGTLNQNGATTHPFRTDAGTVTATLTAVSPDSATVLGLSLGTWNGAACQLVIANDRATQGTILVGLASASGNLCVRLYDAAGGLTQPTSYEVQVVHPQR
jgi:hypothetical protein